MSTVPTTTGTGAPLVASRQLVNRPSGSFEINAREYGTVAAGAIGLAQAAYQGGENAVSTVVHWSEEGLQALEDGAKDVGHAISTGLSEVKEPGRRREGCRRQRHQHGHEGKPASSAAPSAATSPRAPSRARR